jgi:hypothetical protein
MGARLITAKILKFWEDIMGLPKRPVPTVRCLQHFLRKFPASQSRRMKIQIENETCSRSAQNPGVLNATGTNAD